MTVSCTHLLYCQTQIRSPLTLTISFLQGPNKKDRNKEDHQQEEPRHRTGLADLKELEAALVDQDLEQFRRAPRPAKGQRPDNVKDAKGVHDAQQQDH